jgi:hypothetical protein
MIDIEDLQLKKNDKLWQAVSNWYARLTNCDLSHDQDGDIAGYCCPMKLMDELEEILSAPSERAVLAKAEFENEKYKELLAIIKKTNWDVIQKAIEMAMAGEQEPVGYCRDGDLEKEDFVAITEPHYLHTVKLYAHPLPAQEIPEGWQLVPKNVTGEMVGAAKSVGIRYGYDEMDQPLCTVLSPSELYKLWGELLSASPKP